MDNGWGQRPRLKNIARTPRRLPKETVYEKRSLFQEYTELHIERRTRWQRQVAFGQQAQWRNRQPFGGRWIAARQRQVTRQIPWVRELLAALRQDLGGLITLRRGSLCRGLVTTR